MIIEMIDKYSQFAMNSHIIQENKFTIGTLD